MSAIDQLRKRMDDGVLALRLVGSPTPVFHWCRENPAVAAKLLEDCADRAAACDRYREALERIASVPKARTETEYQDGLSTAPDVAREALYGDKA